MQVTQGLAALAATAVLLAGCGSEDNSATDDSIAVLQSQVDELEKENAQLRDQLEAATGADGEPPTTVAAVPDPPNTDVVGTPHPEPDSSLETDRPTTEAEDGPDGDAPSDSVETAAEDHEVGPCTIVDTLDIVVEVANNSSALTSYTIDLIYLDDTGERVGDDSVWIDRVRPGERAVEPLIAFPDDGATSCEIVNVRRSTESEVDTSEVTCEVIGSYQFDALFGIEALFTVSNSSSEMADYYINATLVRDGVRVGTLSADIDNVQPGQPAPDETSGSVSGLPDGVSCEVVYVSRLPS